MAKNISISLPTLSIKRKNDVIEALKSQNITAEIVEEKLNFQLNDDESDNAMVLIGIMIGVNMCKIF